MNRGKMLAANSMALIAVLGVVIAFAAATPIPPPSEVSSHVAEVSFEQGSWQYRAIYSVIGGAPKVTAMFALAEENATTGNNLIAVVYLREVHGEGIADDKWISKSWHSSDKAEIIASVAQYFGLSSEDDISRLGGTLEAIQSVPTPEQPEAYLNGLLEGDPLALAISTSPDHD